MDLRHRWNQAATPSPAKLCRCHLSPSNLTLRLGPGDVGALGLRRSDMAVQQRWHRVLHEGELVVVANEPSWSDDIDIHTSVSDGITNETIRGRLMQVSIKCFETSQMMRWIVS